MIDPTALARLAEFARTWNPDDLIDEDSGLTGADVAAVLDALKRVAFVPRLG